MLIDVYENKELIDRIIKVQEEENKLRSEKDCTLEELQNLKAELFSDILSIPSIKDYAERLNSIDYKDVLAIHKQKMILVQEAEELGILKELDSDDDYRAHEEFMPARVVIEAIFSALKPDMQILFIQVMVNAPYGLSIPLANSSLIYYRLKKLCNENTPWADYSGTLFVSKIIYQSLN